MQIYKGISRVSNPLLFNYIDTYRNLARDNYEQFLDDDETIQKLVSRHYLKRNILITLFNLSFYILPIILIQGF